MAILKDLIVSGSSRLLGKLYANDIEIGNDVEVDGKTTTAQLYVKTTMNNNTNSSVDSNNLPFVVGTISGKHIVMDSDEITAKSGTTGTSNLWINYGGGQVNLGNGGKVNVNDGTLSAHILKASTSLGATNAYVPNAYITTAAITTANTNTINNADMITTSALDVKGKLHAVEYDLENIMDLGGSFVVAPTLIVPSSGSGTKSLTVTKSNNTTVVMTVRDPSITSGGIAGFAWANNYKVKVSGLVNNTVLGTCDGYINTTNVGSNTISLTVTMDAETVTAIATTVTTYKLNIMLYNTDTSSATAVTKPLGIYLQHYQLTNNPIINVWNGQTTTPKVRIGYLGGITYNGSSLGTNAQNSWGLYSDSVFLEGQIIAKGGTIAGWTIGDGYITTNSNRTTYDNTSYTGMTMTASGIGARGSATSYFNLSTGGGLTAVGATVTGVITANTGYIGGTSGWTIAAQQLYSGTIGADNSLHLGTKNLGSNTSIGGRSGSDWRLTVGQHFGVTNTGKIYADSATIIGGITATSFSAEDSNGKERATVNTNGFIVKDASGNTVASLSNDLTLGQVVANRYNVFIDADIGIQNRKNTSVLSQFDSTSIKFYDGSGTAAGNITAQFSGSGAVIGKTSSNHVLLSSNQLQLKNGSTVLADFGSTITLGQTTGQAAVINSDGMEVYKGGIPVAEFGETVVLGKNDEANIEISTEQIQMTEAHGKAAFNVTMSSDKTNVISVSDDQIKNHWTKIDASTTSDVYVLPDDIVNGKPIYIEFMSIKRVSESSSAYVMLDQVSFKFTSGSSSTISKTIAFDSGNRSLTVAYNGARNISFSVSSKLASLERLLISYSYYPTYYNPPTMLVGFGAVRGAFSAGIGEGIYSYDDNQVVVGKYNGSLSSAYLFVIGNGTDDENRSNALTVDQDGNLECGNIKCGYITGELIQNNGHKEYTVTFNEPFPDGTEPIVVATLVAQSSDAAYADVTVSVGTRTESYCKIHIFNKSGSGRTPHLMWMATTSGIQY